MTPTEFAILGLLAERPRSGYDIKKEVETRLAFFWSESYGHIYPMLKRLAQRKLIRLKSATATRGRPARKVYTLTPAGRRALTGWFATPVAPVQPRNELLLRMFFGRHAPAGQLPRDIASFRAEVAERHALLAEVADELERAGADAKESDYWRVVVDYGLRVYDALGTWARGAERELRAIEKESGQA